MKRTEAIICGSKASQLKVSVDSVYIGWSVIPLSNSVRDQGFFLDKNHVDDKSHKFNCKVMFLLCALLGQTTSVPEQKNCKCNTVSLVLSRLDYYNSCLWGMPKKQLMRLQYSESRRLL